MIVPTTPVPKIIFIALTFHFRNIKRAAPNKINSIALKLVNWILYLSELKIPNNKIVKPAFAIKATTAGLKADRTVWTPEKLRYLY